MSLFVIMKPRNFFVGGTENTFFELNLNLFRRATLNTFYKHAAWSLALALLTTVINKSLYNIPNQLTKDPIYHLLINYLDIFSNRIDGHVVICPKIYNK